METITRSKEEIQEYVKSRKIENKHVFIVKYLGPTNTRGSRVKITSERFYSEDRETNQSITIPYNYKFDNSLEIAECWLIENGFNIVSHAEGKNCYYVMSDTFKALKS